MWFEIIPSAAIITVATALPIHIGYVVHKLALGNVSQQLAASRIWNIGSNKYLSDNFQWSDSFVQCSRRMLMSAMETLLKFYFETYIIVFRIISNETNYYNAFQILFYFFLFFYNFNFFLNLNGRKSHIFERTVCLLHQPTSNYYRLPLCKLIIDLMFVVFRAIDATWRIASIEHVTHVTGRWMSPVIPT